MKEEVGVAKYVKQSRRRRADAVHHRLSTAGVYRLAIQRTRGRASASGTSDLLETPFVRQTVTRCENLLRASVELQDLAFYKEAKDRIDNWCQQDNENDMHFRLKRIM